MYKINYLFSNFRNNKEFVDLYIVEDNRVKLINIEEEIEENFIKKGLSISEDEGFELDEDEGLLDAFFKKDRFFSKSPDLKECIYFKEAQNLPGAYFPRINKPVLSKSARGIKPRDYKVKELEKDIKQYQEFVPHNQKELISSVNQLSVLSQNLGVLFQTIQPDNNNYEVFGHNIRNL